MSLYSLTPPWWHYHDIVRKRIKLPMETQVLLYLDYVNLDIIQLMTIHAMPIAAISVWSWAKPPTLCGMSSFSGITG